MEEKVQKIIEEQRLKRKIEWDKVTNSSSKSHNPSEIIEKRHPSKDPDDDAQDSRPLYDRLLEQKLLQEDEWREKARLSTPNTRFNSNTLGNYIRKLEDDELAFLDEKRDEDAQIKRKHKKIEDDEVSAFRETVIKTNESEPDLKIPALKPKSKAKVALVKKKAAAKSSCLVDYEDD